MNGLQKILTAQLLAVMTLFATGCVVGTTKPDFNYAELRITTDDSDTCWRIEIDGDSRLGCGIKTYSFNSDKGHFKAKVIKRSGLGRLSAEIWADDEFVESGSTQDLRGSFTLSSKD